MGAGRRGLEGPFPVSLLVFSGTPALGSWVWGTNPWGLRPCPPLLPGFQEGSQGGSGQAPNGCAHPVAPVSLPVLVLGKACAQPACRASGSVWPAGAGSGREGRQAQKPQRTVGTGAVEHSPPGRQDHLGKQMVAVAAPRTRLTPTHLPLPGLRACGPSAHEVVWPRLG